ncbi:DUF6157 family protein [Bacillus sp. JJ1562]|uniref:DUF6157 family protein n=1 Tax=Bacillus sp. JJ1562 TaxID=3122960 RepID=UPI003002701E
MSYKNTFIVISEDSSVSSAIVPAPKKGKITIASIEYDLISNHPYEYTQEDVQLKTYLMKNQIDRETEELREEFFSKPKACFRVSPLVKKYGWGIHYDEEGKIALYDVSSLDYERLSKTEDIKVLKGMRTSRK